MANNYLQFSLAFPLKTDAEKKWCVETLNGLSALLNNDFNLDADDDATAPRKKLAKDLGDLGQRVLDEEWDVCDFQWSINPVDQKAAGPVAEMWIYADESGDPDQVAAVLQAYLQKFNPQGSLWFSWAYTCSKIGVNEFGGGAAVVTAAAIKFIDAQHWAQEEAEKALGSRHPEASPAT